MLYNLKIPTYIETVYLTVKKLKEKVLKIKKNLRIVNKFSNENQNKTEGKKRTFQEKPYIN